jgi:MoxR-like ATPase
MDMSKAAQLATAVTDEIERAVVGRREALRHVLVAILAGGHVLLEDLPGLGKTQIARCFAQALGLRFTRVQFTPDLLPADLTGSSIYDPRTSQFSFHPGPVFTNVLLADEINRTPPKTQAALLEAMQERQVSVDGETMPLPDPFIVLATDNPVEYEGTYPLPEAQLDRFAVRLALGYLPETDEAALLRRRLARTSDEIALTAVADPETIIEMRACVEQVHVDDDLVDYVLRLLTATRNHPQVTIAASPRAGLMLMQLARARAMLDEREYVIVEDVKAVAVPALAHRLGLRPELWVRQISGVDIVRELLATVPAPATAPAQHDG